MLEDKRPLLLEDLGMFYITNNSKRRVRFGLYKCGYCGKEFKGNTYDVKGGKQKSCGCLKGELHGLSRHRFYNTWSNMIKRCNNNSNNPDYKNYGGRGITICEEWLDVKNFFEWAKATYVEGMTLDRIDVDGNYEPSNCRWTDRYVQSANQRIKKNNTSGFTGVYWKEGVQNWEVYIRYKNISNFLGSFKELQEAIVVRDNYIISNNLPHKLSKDYIKKEENDKEEYRGI